MTMDTEIIYSSFLFQVSICTKIGRIFKINEALSVVANSKRIIPNPARTYFFAVFGVSFFSGFVSSFSGLTVLV
jgi:hypothetical protein